MNGKLIRQEIEKHLDIIKDMDPRDPEYDIMVESLEHMTGLNRETFLGGLDINEIIKACIALGTTVIVLNYEKVNVIRSKAFGMFRR